MFDQEQVKEEEAEDYAKEKGLIFQVTSAFKGIGIEELFKNIGTKLVDPKYKDKFEDQPINDENDNNNSENIKLDLNNAKDDNTKKNYCCNYI